MNLFKSKGNWENVNLDFLDKEWFSVPANRRIIQGASVTDIEQGIVINVAYATGDRHYRLNATKWENFDLNFPPPKMGENNLFYLQPLKSDTLPKAINEAKLLIRNQTAL